MPLPEISKGDDGTFIKYLAQRGGGGPYNISSKAIVKERTIGNHKCIFVKSDSGHQYLHIPTKISLDDEKACNVTERVLKMVLNKINKFELRNKIDTTPEGLMSIISSTKKVNTMKHVFYIKVSGGNLWDAMPELEEAIENYSKETTIQDEKIRVAKEAVDTAEAENVETLYALKGKTARVDDLKKTLQQEKRIQNNKYEVFNHNVADILSSLSGTNKCGGGIHISVCANSDLGRKIAANNIRQPSLIEKLLDPIGKP